MTPDKVEAALASLKQVSAAIACPDLPRRTRADESRWAATITEALSVLTESLGERGWRPIESAPMPGKFLVYLEEELMGSRIHAANWHKNVKTIATNFHFDCPKPTHWKPLPEPPHDR